VSLLPASVQTVLTARQVASFTDVVQITRDVAGTDPVFHGPTETPTVTGTFLGRLTPISGLDPEAVIAGAVADRLYFRLEYPRTLPNADPGGGALWFAVGDQLTVAGTVYQVQATPEASTLALSKHAILYRLAGAP
jgi:hypothetical protein